MQRIIELVLSILCVIISTVSVFNGNMDNAIYFLVMAVLLKV
jgi:hypothetical protein